MFTGLFLAAYQRTRVRNDVIVALEDGGEAWRNSIYPGTLIDLAMQVFQNTIKHVNFLQPESIVAPIVIALLVLFCCSLTVVNMIILLCVAWVVVYAGLIFLGFGGCRWTSDMAINYYRTILGVGVSLMTMQLIIRLVISFLQDLFPASGQTQDGHTLDSLM